MSYAIHLRRSLLFAVIVLCITRAACGAEPATTTQPPAMTAYRQHLDAHVRKQIPAITAAAEAVADRWLQHKSVMLHYPFGGDASNFSMEFCSRAGGLANAAPNTMRVAERTADDVVVYGIRSWEKGGAFFMADAAKHHAEGRLIVVFGSKAGVPAGAPIDILIDNYAATGSEDEAAVNQIVNITQGWMWTSELAAAFTRKGRHPGVLLGMPIPGSQAELKIYQDFKPTLYPCDSQVPAGKLAQAYLDAVNKELADLESPVMQAQINHAADIAVAHLRAGKSVYMSSFTHVLDGEVFSDNRAPTKPFRGISCGPHGEFFKQNLKPGDLLFWFGEWSLNMPWFDYLTIIRETKADYIPCWRRTEEKTEGWDHPELFWNQKVDDAAMVLEQHWPFLNAAVDVPFAPQKMAPISGVYVCLQYRTLDEAIARKLAAATLPAP